MSANVSVAPGRLSLEVNHGALNVTLFFATDLPYVALELGLSTVLFGILTTLFLVAVFFLAGNGLRRTSVRVLLLSTLLLYMSTTLWIATKGWYITSVGRAVSSARGGLYSDADIGGDVAVLSRKVSTQSLIMTMALGLNVVLGDSIVWWRACAVWRNRLVYYGGALLIALTVGFGIVAIALGDHECPCHECPCLFPNYLFQDGAFSKVSAVLSLSTNIFATALIAYKAWQHRRVLRGRTGERAARVARALILLIESGTIYCILLILLVLYEIGPAKPNTPLHAHQNMLLRAESYYTFGCFVPIVAIYPMLIIVLVALNCSPIDNGMSGMSQGGTATAAATESGDAMISNIAFGSQIRPSSSEIVEDIPMFPVKGHRKMRDGKSLQDVCAQS
ncbi:hypothetical protein BD311DRAFT_747542 [Dichomitus squalens]|uniref:G-protein coupled receptors family 1 profile domain-containing protein n=1 Tax=Dichomitus squalens TaxID=114155 RepID=A0A4Q9N311_9APHY|nr:hypothetical protein BD311DRAFT_747542 [Dichomitus squalens]